MFTCLYVCCFFFFKQKTAYEMRISDWSSDVCSSDLIGIRRADLAARMENPRKDRFRRGFGDGGDQAFSGSDRDPRPGASCLPHRGLQAGTGTGEKCRCSRSEEHTSELQSLMRISYAVFCLKKKNKQN